MLTALIGAALLNPSYAQVGQPQLTSSSVRLALTPDLNGHISDEEWDSLGMSSGGRVFFQWDPDALHWAGEAKSDQDVVLSLDYNGDGWLVGDDNYEIRTSFATGEPTILVRRLDATDKSGPQWKPGGLAAGAIQVAAAATASGWTLEASYSPPSNAKPKASQRLGIRVDTVGQDDDLGEPFRPRSMAFLVLQFNSSINLPANMSWKPILRTREVAREEKLTVEYEIKRDDETIDFDRFSYRGEGLIGDFIATGRQPFPPFDGSKLKLRYDSIIAEEARSGWRVLRAELKDGLNEPVVLRTSIRVANFIEFDFRMTNTLNASDDAQILRGSIVLKSSAMGRLEGDFNLEAPSDWTISNGASAKYLIYHPHGTFRVPIEVIIPKGTVGVFPVTATATVGERVMTKTLYLTLK
jgi:hypothetical protein